MPEKPQPTQQSMAHANNSQPAASPQHTTPQRPGSIAWTPANIVTCIRVVLVPFWLLAAQLVSPVSVGGAINGAGIAIFLFFAFISLTDKIDGYLARSRNEVTVFGKFLDPIADKLVVVTGMVWLLQYQLVPVWAIVLVVAREFLVSGLRMVVSSKGTVIAASNLGKWKTASTMIALCGYMLILALPPLPALHLALDLIFYLAMLLTAWSGIDYFVKSIDYLGED